MRQLQVKRGNEFTYPIYFEDGFEELKTALSSLDKNFQRVCIVTDTNVAPLYLETVKTIFADMNKEVCIHILKAGEEHKTLEQIQEIYTTLIENKFDRKDLLAALGGGVVGDMTGFAAATYLRGIDFIQIPTTLLAQVDSSIGGKTGVDFLKYKNMVGAFHQPILVYENIAALKSLTDEQFSCGMGEIVKHGMIRDKEYFTWLEEQKDAIWNRDISVLREMIYKSCVIKKTVVENDPTEKGERAVLNMGHTIGHAIEKLKNFSLLHGQCVAIGCIASARISQIRGLISNEQMEQILALFKTFRLPVKTDGLSLERIIEVTHSDKKMQAGKIKFVWMEKMGYAVADFSVTDEELKEAVSYILQENEK